MNVFNIGTTEYTLIVSKVGETYVYRLSYVDCAGKSHVIDFSDLSDYSDFIGMLTTKYLRYV